jgi:putative ABC transport system substrate-binding protein
MFSSLNYIFTVISVLLVFVSLTLGDVSAGEKKFDIAMVTWRGETDAEQGFVQGVEKSALKVVFQHYDAARDLVRLDGIITRVKQLSPDLVYVFGTTATQRVLARITDLPVVFNIVSRPVDTGIIKSWENSGNNATGASSKVPLPDQLKSLKKVVNYQRLGIIYNPMEANSIIQRELAKQQEKFLGFTLVDFKISSRGDIEKAFFGLSEQVDAVYLPADSTTKTLGREIMGQVNHYRIPSLAALESMVEKDQALLGLVPNYYQLGRLAAKKAIQILQGVLPSHIPSSTLDYFQIHVNMVTAQKIGVHIPTSILVISDKIVRKNPAP